MRNKTWLQDFSRRAYRRVLLLYPFPLRCEFGEEMAEVFSEQLRDECAESGLAGLARVWWRVAVEVVEGGWPAEADWARLGIRVAALAISFAAFMIFAWASGAGRHCVK